MSQQPIQKPSLSWKRLFLKAFLDAHRRRPASFYLLLLIPIVLLLGAHVFTKHVSLLYFSGIFLLMLIFFWIVMMWAVRDLFIIYKQKLQEEASVYKETLGTTLTKGESDKDEGSASD